MGVTIQSITCHKTGNVFIATRPTSSADEDFIELARVLAADHGFVLEGPEQFDTATFSHFDKQSLYGGTLAIAVFNQPS